MQYLTFLARDIVAPGRSAIVIRRFFNYSFPLTRRQAGQINEMHRNTRHMFSVSSKVLMNRRDLFPLPNLLCNWKGFLNLKGKKASKGFSFKLVSETNFLRCSQLR